MGVSTKEVSELLFLERVRWATQSCTDIFIDVRFVRLLSPVLRLEGADLFREPTGVEGISLGSGVEQSLVALDTWFGSLLLRRSARRRLHAPTPSHCDCLKLIKKN